MNHNPSQTTVTPTVEYLTDILSEILTGSLRVPNFQRPFVWKPDDMIALFESIYNGYPIGSLLFWKADKNYNTLAHIGPYKLKENVSTPINYILDGHQRLSTLFGVLTNMKNESMMDSVNDYRWTIYYDLETDNFLHVKSKDLIQSTFFPLNKLLKTTEFIKETRKILSTFGEKGEVLIEKAEKLLQIFRGYRIAITQIEGGGLESAVHIFSRLNTKGVQMSIDRMYSALTYKEGKDSFNLSARIDEIKDKLAIYNFDDVDRMIIFRSILAAAGKNLYTKGKFDLFDDNENISEIVESCERSLVKAVRFLNERLNVPSNNFLPHSLQLIILSEFFRLAGDPSEKKLEVIEKWFWVSSYVGIDIVNSSKKRQTLEEVRTFAKVSEKTISSFVFRTVKFKGEAIPYPNRFDLNSSRVRAFTLFLASLKPISLSTHKEYNTKEMLGKSGYKAFNYITRAVKNDSNLLSNPANRMIAPQEDKGQIAKYLKELVTANLFSELYDKNKILESHGIPSSAVELLIMDNLSLFLKKRHSYLIKLERKFILSKGIKPNKKDSTFEIFPDTE